MNVACTACPAKYAVPDEKVRGRKVKITCKHCGTAIVVDGTKMAGGSPAASVAPAKASAVPVRDAASLAPSPKAEAPAAEPAAPQAPAPQAPAQAEPAPAPAPEPPREEPAAGAAEPEPSAAAAAAEPESSGEIEWIVAFSDDRQDPATTAQVVEYYAAGHIDEGTYIWREGMADWAAPYDIPELCDALRAAGVARRSPAPPPFVGDEDEATRVAPSPVEAETGNRTSGVWREPGRVGTPLGAEETPAPAPKEEAPQPAEPAPKPAAARKSVAPKAAAKAEPAGLASKTEPSTRAAIKSASAQRGTAARRRDRSAEVDDLFGSIAQAGSEQDASLHAESPSAEAPRLTGQRNESSVLFSLDALLKTEKSQAKAPPKKEDEATILFGEPAPSSIANVGTGAIGVALAAPDFTAPVAAPPPSAPRSAAIAVDVGAPPAKKKSLGWLVAVLVLAGGAAAAFALGVPQKLMSPPAPSATLATAAPEPEKPAPQGTAAPEDAPAPAPSAAPEASTAAAASAAPPSAPAPAEAEAKPASPAEAKPAAGDKPADKAPKDAPAPSGDLPPFDRAAAAAALRQAAANASSCRQPGGAMGSGRVTITFAPSGRATSTNVSGEVAGTTVGGCVARLFRAVKVPPFSGDPVTVGKSFSVE